MVESLENKLCDLEIKSKDIEILVTVYNLQMKFRLL